MNKKTYINGFFINEKEFANGGSILKVNMSEDGLKSLQAAFAAKSENGWLRLQIGSMKSPMVSKKDASKIIATHSFSVDDWKPGSQASNAPVEDDPFR